MDEQKKNILERIKAFLSDEKPKTEVKAEAEVVVETGEAVSAETEVKLEAQKLDNGTMVEAEAFEAGQPIFIVGEDENIPLPIGEYEMAGKIIVVAEDGLIAEIKEAAVEEEPEMESEYVTKTEFNDFVDEIKSLLSKQVKETNNELSKLEEEKLELEKEKEVLTEELAKKPDAKKIVHAPKDVKAVDLNKTGKVLDVIRNLKQ